MKKLLSILAAITATALTTFGQGSVWFNNQRTFNPSDAITVATFVAGGVGGNPGDGIGGDKYAVQLVWVAGTGLSYAQFEAGPKTFGAVVTGVGVQGSANNAFFAPTGPLATFSGFFDAGLIPNSIGTSMPVGGYTMQVQAWYNVGFATYDASLAAGKNVGKSALFNVIAVAMPAPVNETVFPGFQVGVLDAPEPSTLSLGILGVLMMLWFRRKMAKSEQQQKTT